MGIVNLGEDRIEGHALPLLDNLPFVLNLRFMVVAVRTSFP